MIVTISSRHMDVSPALKEHAENRSKKLEKYYDRIQQIEVIVDAHANHHLAVEMIVNGENKNLFIAREEGDDAYKLIDACIDKLERQLTDHHKKLKNRKHPA